MRARAVVLAMTLADKTATRPRVGQFSRHKPFPVFLRWPLPKPPFSRRRSFQDLQLTPLFSRSPLSSHPPLFSRHQQPPRPRRQRGLLSSCLRRGEISVRSRPGGFPPVWQISRSDSFLSERLGRSSSSRCWRHLTVSSSLRPLFLSSDLQPGVSRTWPEHLDEKKNRKIRGGNWARFRGRRTWPYENSDVYFRRLADEDAHICYE